MDVLYHCQEDSGISSIPLWLKAMRHRRNSGQDGPSYGHRKDKPVPACGTTFFFHIGTLEFWVYPKLQGIQAISFNRK